MLETALKNLFDYQRFERAPALQAVIDEALDRCGPNRLLSLADDDLVMAAGGTRELEPQREPDDDADGTI